MSPKIFGASLRHGLALYISCSSNSTKERRQTGKESSSFQLSTVTEQAMLKKSWATLRKSKHLKGRSGMGEQLLYQGEDDLIWARNALGRTWPNICLQSDQPTDATLHPCDSVGRQAEFFTTGWFFWLVPHRKVLSMELVPPNREKITKFAGDCKNPY